MDNIALLLKVEFFKGLEADELLSIMAVSRRDSCAIGQRLFEAGSLSDALYVIRKGSVMVKNGQIVLAVLGVGDTIGEMSFVDEGYRSASIVAIEDTELVKLPFESLFGLFDKNPRLAAKVYRAIATVLSQRLRDMDEHIKTKFRPVEL